MSPSGRRARAGPLPRACRVKPGRRPQPGRLGEGRIALRRFPLAGLPSRPRGEGVDRSSARDVRGARVGGSAQSQFRRDLALTYGALASRLSDEGKREEALACWSRTIAQYEALLGDNPADPTIGHDLVRNLGNMGITLASAGRRLDAPRPRTGCARFLNRWCRPPDPAAGLRRPGVARLGFRDQSDRVRAERRGPCNVGTCAGGA